MLVLGVGFGEAQSEVVRLTAGIDEENNLEVGSAMREGVDKFLAKQLTLVMQIAGVGIQLLDLLGDCVSDMLVGMPNMTDIVTRVQITRTRPSGNKM